MELKIRKVVLSDGITGIIDNKDNFVNVFKEINFIEEIIYKNGKRITSQEKKNLYKEIVLINDMQNLVDYNMTVYEYLKKIVLDEELSLRNYHKKITDSMKIISFSVDYLNKSISQLSRYEKKMIILAGQLLKNPNIIVFKGFFRGIDLKNTKTIMRLLGQMVDKYNKKIIICSDDVDFLYNNTNNIVVYGENLIIQGKTNAIFEEKGELLKENEINIPFSVQFVSKCRSHGINLNYNKDVRDLIKDIYKKV